MAFPEPVKTPHLKSAFESSNLFYDPMAAKVQEANIAGAQARAAESRMRTRVDEMRIAEMAKQQKMDEELARAGENLFQAVPEEGPVEAGPEYKGMMQNLLGEGFPYEPSVRAETTVQTPIGPMKRSDMAKMEPMFRGKMMAEQGKIQAARAEAARLEIEKTQRTKIEDAQKRVAEFIKKGEAENFDAYRTYLASDPDLAPLAKTLENVKLTGIGKGEGERFFTAEQLKAADPTGTFTSGIPGVYTFKFGDGKTTLKRAKLDRDAMVNLALNGSPEEQQWAKDQMIGLEKYAPRTQYTDFALGESDKVRKEHPNWSEGEIRNEVFKRWNALQAEQKQALLGIRTEVKKEQWEKEVQEVGDAIISGQFAPDLSQLGRGEVFRTMLAAYLARNKFNLADANADWLARKRWIAAVNSPQQLRLRQATEFAYDSLDIIEDLARKWNAGPYPILNKVNLLAAKNGAMGKDAQVLATQMDTMIADLTSELGTVYKGGNSSTDESLRLAQQNLRADWSVDQLLANVDLARKNLNIRKNTMRHVGVAGVKTPTDQVEDDAVFKEYEAKREKRKTVLESKGQLLRTDLAPSRKNQVMTKTDMQRYYDFFGGNKEKMLSAIKSDGWEMPK